MSEAQHHLHIRKRIHIKHEQYPHPDATRRLLDHLIYIIAFLGPLMTVPQIYTIFEARSAAGVSVISFGSYTLFNVVWLFYGRMHKDTAITLNSIFWIIANGLVVVGALIYR